METIEILKIKFEKYAIEQYIALCEGSGKKANCAHKKIHLLYLKIRNLDRVDIFTEFLHHEHENVRLWAAGFCLKAYPHLAEKELKKLSKSSDFFISSAAKCTLKLYQNNEWDKLLI